VDSGTSSFVESLTHGAAGTSNLALAAPTRVVAGVLVNDSASLDPGSSWVWGFHSTAYWWCRFTSHAQSGETHVRAARTTAIEDRVQTRSRRLNPALAAARLPGRVTATEAMGVRFWLFIAQRGRANRTGTIRAILHLTTILSVQGSTSDASREVQVRQ